MTVLTDIAAKIEEIIRVGIDTLSVIGDPSEADTQDHLIVPVLEALGYPRENTRRHVTDGSGNYPDRLVWSVPVKDAEQKALPARFIIEEKSFGTDFERIRAKRADAPVRQIGRYLRQHRLSDDSTVGILTDGGRWRLYKRTTDPQNGHVTIEQTWEFDLGQGAPERITPSLLPTQGRFEDFVARLGASWFDTSSGSPPLFADGKRFLSEAVSAIAKGDPVGVVDALAKGPLTVFRPNFPSTGLVVDARERDWEANMVVAHGPEYEPLQPVQPSLVDGGPPRITLAAVPFRWEESAVGNRLRKGDIDFCARVLKRADAPLVLCAYMQDPKTGSTWMRLAVHVSGSTAMTTEFDPEIPPASVLLKIDKLTRMLWDKARNLTPSALKDAFDILPLQREFYARIEKWIETYMKEDEEHDRAIVRHLIRTMFAWILKEHRTIPGNLFERDFMRIALKDKSTGEHPHPYHDTVLSSLYHATLNCPTERRNKHPIADVDELLDMTPFLNGSIFTQHPTDALVRLPDKAYWSDDPSVPGLYDILGAFQWTMDEHSALTHDLSLDPELLGTLFERLVSLVDHSKPKRNRKPKGTYYTPRDVVTAMVTDALVARIEKERLPGVTEFGLRKLFSAEDTTGPDWDQFTRDLLKNALKDLTILDPAVGSGVFLLGILEVMMLALRKLDRSLHSRRARGRAIREIIQNQLHGIDVQPLASQITKLRLYLAIEATEGTETDPLPNLEARIVNADALGTIPDPDWLPGMAGTLADIDQEFRDLLSELIANRRAWFGAYEEERKRLLRSRDRKLRASLEECIRKLPLTESDWNRSFAKWSPLELDDSVAVADPRLVFGRDPSAAGFDIVVGNPPYGSLSQSKKYDAKKRGYRWVGAGRSEALFLELAMSLASPTKGILEFVLPLGISFRQDHSVLRSGMEDMSSRIELRHYDMTPGRIFNTDPTAKSWPNKQRAILMTASRGSGGLVRTSGLRRWFEKPGCNERADCLANLRTIDSLGDLGSNVDMRISRQWLRTPTGPARQLLRELVRQERRIGNLVLENGLGEHVLAMPMTAYQYVSTLPLGAVKPRLEQPLHFQGEEDLKIAFVALNGHVFYGYWLMTDDGFHVNLHVALSMGIPDSWLRQGRERKSALELADRLLDAIPYCITGKRNADVQWQNVDFFSHAPDLIRQIDGLQIGSLGIPLEPVIDDLRIMRSSSSWNLPGASSSRNHGS